MTNIFLPLNGEQIPSESLTISKAIEIFRTINVLNSPYVTFVYCFQLTDFPDSESVVFDVAVQLSQRLVNDIKPTERICVTFNKTDTSYPEVWAIRRDFPLTVSHRNLRDYERPVSLCLYEIPYNEFKLEWNPVGFIERIRDWLSLTSRGELHEDDQPLEPLFFPSQDRIIVNESILEELDNSTPFPLNFFPIKGINGGLTLVTQFLDQKESFPKEEVFGVAAVFVCPPQPHGIINKTPQTFHELNNICNEGGLDLLGNLREILKQWFKQESIAGLWNKFLILLIAFPKQRNLDGKIESSDLWCFYLSENIETVGVDIGILEKGPAGCGLSLLPVEEKTGTKVKLNLLTPIYEYSKKQALRLNGYEQPSSFKIGLIGLGAIGSQVFLNLIRSGIGKWILIDNDIFLPHNLARHALLPQFVGWPKSVSLSYVANSFFDTYETVTHHEIDILDNQRNKKALSDLAGLDVIIDMSVSIAVSRFITHDVDSTARKISVFLNPSGSDLIILCEPTDRSIKLDFIEMQYYRHIINSIELKHHLKIGNRGFRYANSCRDVSSIIPQDQVALNSAIASCTIKKILNRKKAFGAVWASDKNQDNIKKYEIEIADVDEVKVNDWTLFYDAIFLKKIYALREEKLSNETGGVLIGSYDNQRKILYVVDTIPSPSDSIEWPNVYIRGCRGLKNKIEIIQQKTLNRLTYIGEWHSHGKGVGASPSIDDKKAYKWLMNHMKADGLPPLMLIAGDNTWQFHMMMKH